MTRSAVIAPRNVLGAHVPLLFYPALAARARGAEITPLEWNGKSSALPQARPIVVALDAPLLIGSSKGSRIAPLAAELGLPAIWITPILSSRDVVNALRTTSAPFLLIGGTADSEYWRADLAHELTPNVLEIVWPVSSERSQTVL